MSGVIGKGNRSYIKQATGDSLLPDFNVTSLLWVHEITAAEVAGRAVGTTFRIDFSALNFPTSNELRQNGLTNPTSTRILALGIGNHRTNLSIKTSLKRELIDFLSYEADDTGITLDADVSIVAGESWIFTFDQNVQTGNRVVNARPLRKTGIIPSQRRRVAIGSTIQIAPSIINADGIDEQQIGNVQVFAEGKLLFRNPGNAEGDILTSGNYREVFLSNTSDSGIEGAIITLNGTANAIELNTALTQEADIMIISTNLIVDSETNTISTLTNSAATKLAEFPTLEPANAGRFLTVNATGDSYQLSAASSPLGIIQVDTYETASGTFTNYLVPANTTALRITAAGGGASGSNGVVIGFGSNGSGGQGGAAGEYDVRYIPVTGSGQMLNVVIGGPNSPTSISGTGISTSTWAAGGGAGGFGGTASIRSGTGIATGENVQITSRSGSPASTGAGTGGGGGAGGNTPRALGGRGGNSGGGGAGTGGGGGGAGWVNGATGGNGAISTVGSGSAGGRGGMVIEALAFPVNVN